jgi:hypothetical protein
MNHEEMFSGESMTSEHLLTKLSYIQLLRKDFIPWCAVNMGIVTARWSKNAAIY